MSLVDVNVKINDRAITNRIKALCDDGQTMLEINNLLAKMCDPYVPFLEGPLSQTVIVTSESVRYIQPYARRQYYGTSFNHTLEYHPLASAKWDKAMMADRGDEFAEQVSEILSRRAEQLYG